jgi:methyltransferase family protein
VDGSFVATEEKNQYFDGWLSALERRHLADLTRPELTRALRALSSCYVERRARLAGGAALEGAGKRAAFALFYAPLHFLTVANVLQMLNAPAVRTIVDLGCGTGAAGAAWALACKSRPTISAIDRSAWAVAEANWTYRQLGVRGRAKTGDMIRVPLPPRGSAGILLAYAVNELRPEQRSALLDRVARSVRDGTALIVVEPIARRGRDWWDEWVNVLGREGARSDEWRFPADLPPLLRSLADAAGLTLRELTARTLFKTSRHSDS